MNIPWAQTVGFDGTDLPANISLQSKFWIFFVDRPEIDVEDVPRPVNLE